MNKDIQRTFEFNALLDVQIALLKELLLAQISGNDTARGLDRAIELVKELQHKKETSP
jgi:hypothetical protein